MITIAMADDHVLIREAIASLINTFEGYQVVCSADSGRDLIDYITKNGAPHIVILDVNMPGINGYAAAAWLKKNHPHTHVLVLTMYDSEVMMVRLMASGVRGFLKKDVHPKELKTALDLVMEKGYYYHGDSSARLANLFNNIPENTLTLQAVMLSEKEIEFIRLACSDDTYKVIAEKMNSSLRTIDSMRDAVFAKLHMNNRVSLALFAVHHGILVEE